MKKLRNWDNKTWLSSKSYIYQFNKFLKTKINLNKNSKILDIGCGRAIIISALQQKFKFRYKAIGIDIVRNKNIKKNIIFKKNDGIDFLKKNKKNYDLILLKQTIHFLSSKKINLLLKLAKSRLTASGKLLIFSLKTKNNKIPCFKKMKTKLENSLKRDEKIFKIIKKNFKNNKKSYFSFTVKISLKKYIKMIKNRYISCLLEVSNKDLINGMNELNSIYKDKIKFKDTLICLEYKK